jgi:hypothetical protein
MIPSGCYMLCSTIHIGQVKSLNSPSPLCSTTDASGFLGTREKSTTFQEPSCSTRKLLHDIQW